MFLIVSIFWFIWMLKYVLFWLYLWQLKEYHIGRFIDHFRTYKGKKLLFNFEQIFKLVLLLFLTFSFDLFNFLFAVISLFYIAESVIFIRGILNKSVKIPVKTFKILFLTLISFATVILFLFWNSNFSKSEQTSYLLIFDILTPLIISFVVLLFQPFFVFIRNIKLKKAQNKIEKIKSSGNLKIIAITGSYGKTTTKEFLTTILSEKLKVLSTKEHQNSEIGIAKCILEDLSAKGACLPAGQGPTSGGKPYEIFIAEVGAYNKGKVKEVCSMLKPDIGIVTGVNEQHLALFGSLNNLLSAEGGEELAEFLEKDGLLVVNGDNKYCLDLIKKFNGREKIYSENKNAINSEIWAESISAHKNFISLLVRSKKGEMADFKVNVLGKQNAQNLLGAILVAKELGMNFAEISEAATRIKQEQAGITLKKTAHGIEVVDSSYSSNPDGVFADLDYFSIFSNKKVIVMPCLIELGKKSSEIHEKIGRKIGEICDMAIITSKDRFKELKEGAVKSGMLEKNILLCDNPREIYSAITLFCKSGDAVLLEGRVPSGLINLLK